MLVKGAIVSEQQETTGDQIVVEREIGAPAAQIFAILADPKLHQATDASGMVRGTDADAITAAGQSFDMNMHAEAMGGDYVMTNEVLEFEQDRRIAWRPAPKGKPAEGWTWTYALEQLDAGRTRVTLTYDWSAVPEARRAELGGFPPMSREGLEASISKLSETVEGSQPGGMQSIVAPGAAPGQATTLAGNVAADVASPHEFRSSTDGRRR